MSMPSTLLEEDTTAAHEADFGSATRRATSTPRWHWALAGGVLMALSLVLWSHVWFGGHPTSQMTCGCGDPVQQVWWFSWVPAALSHGHNPLLTHALWARFGGVNAMSNTSWLVPAFVLWPVTALFGPVASFNVANLVAPVLSGLGAFAFSSLFTRRLVTRVVAAAIFAFCPYFLRNVVLGHVGLTMAVYLPLVLLIGFRILDGTTSWRRGGVLIGALTIVQFFIGLEVIAITGIVAGLSLVVASVLRWQKVFAARGALLRAGFVAGAMCAVMLAYPIWFFFAGPRHVDGPFWKVLSFPLDRLWTLSPSAGSSDNYLSAIGYLGPKGPDVSYLGIGLVIVIIISIPLLYRSRRWLGLLLIGTTLWLLEGVPAGLWSSLPIASSIVPGRFADPVALCFALCFSVGLETWCERAATKFTHHRRVIEAAVVVIGFVALVPLIGAYNVPLRVQSVSEPRWFVLHGHTIPSGTAVVTIPFSGGIESRPMLWQAQDRLSFDLVGGWVFIPGGDGHHDQMVSPLPGAPAILRDLSTHPASVTPAQLATLRATLISWAPVDVVWVGGLAKSGAIAPLARAIGHQPIRSDGSLIWHITRPPEARRQDPQASGAMGRDSRPLPHHGSLSDPSLR